MLKTHVLNAATALTLAVSFLTAPLPADAQKDRMGTGEQLQGQVIPGKASSTPAAPEMNIGVSEVKPGSVQISGADLTAKRLTPEIARALGFLLRWGKGTSTAPGAEVHGNIPVEVGGKTHPLKDVKLILPVNGLQQTADGVKVSKAKVQAPGGQPVSGSLTLSMKDKQVTKVTVN